MDLDVHFNDLIKRYRKVERQIAQLEDDGDYGSPEYDRLVELEMELSAEIDAVEEEFDR